MSASTQAIQRANGTKRPTHNSSKRPRLYGFLSTPERFDVTDWQDKAHRANCLCLTPRKGAGLGFVNTSRLAGFAQNPNARRKLRKALRLAGWIRRTKATADQANAARAVVTEPVAESPKPAGIIAKASRFLGRVFGRKGGR